MHGGGRGRSRRPGRGIGSSRDCGAMPATPASAGFAMPPTNATEPMRSPFATLLARFAPGVQSMLGLDGAAWLREIVIGISVAAIAVPGGLALAQLIGLPPEAGLYACIVPTLVYALFGYSSRYMIVGPDTPTCMLIAGSIAE